jgi:battenin
VVILSAALDLVPSTTPKGLILLFNIFPSLLAKAFWPYISRGRVRYGKRIVAGVIMGVGGIVVSHITLGNIRERKTANTPPKKTVALFENLFARLFGIGVASFASGTKYLPSHRASRR